MDDGECNERPETHTVDLDGGHCGVDINVLAEAVSQLLSIDSVHVALVAELKRAGRDDLLDDIHRVAHLHVRQRIKRDRLAADKTQEDVAQAAAETLARQGIKSTLEGHRYCFGVDDDGQVEALSGIDTDDGVLPRDETKASTNNRRLSFNGGPWRYFGCPRSGSQGRLAGDRWCLWYLGDWDSRGCSNRRRLLDSGSTRRVGDKHRREKDTASSDACAQAGGSAADPIVKARPDDGHTAHRHGGRASDQRLDASHTLDSIASALEQTRRESLGNAGNLDVLAADLDGARDATAARSGRDTGHRAADHTEELLSSAVL